MRLAAAGVPPLSDPVGRPEQMGSTMSDTLAATCPHCRKSGEVPSAYAGREIGCPQCKKRFVVAPAPMAGQAVGPRPQNDAGNAVGATTPNWLVIGVAAGLIVLTAAASWFYVQNALDNERRLQTAVTKDLTERLAKAETALADEQAAKLKTDEAAIQAARQRAADLNRLKVEADAAAQNEQQRHDALQQRRAAQRAAEAKLEYDLMPAADQAQVQSILKQLTSVGVKGLGNEELVFVANHLLQFDAAAPDDVTDALVVFGDKKWGQKHVQFLRVTDPAKARSIRAAFGKTSRVDCAQAVWIAELISSKGLAALGDPNKEFVTSHPELFPYR